jgi:hypothetical protein
MPDTATLEAHLAISKVKARYCRMLDTKDWAGFGALFRGLRARLSRTVRAQTRPVIGISAPVIALE